MYKLFCFFYTFLCGNFVKIISKIQTTKVIFLIFDILYEFCDPKFMVLWFITVLFPCTSMLLPCILPTHLPKTPILMEYRIDGLNYRIFIITYHTIINILNMYIIYYLYIKYTNKIYFYI